MEGAGGSKGAGAEAVCPVGAQKATCEGWEFRVLGDGSLGQTGRLWGLAHLKTLAVWPFKESFLQRRIQSGPGPAGEGPSSANSFQV